MGFIIKIKQDTDLPSMKVIPDFTWSDEESFFYFVEDRKAEDLKVFPFKNGGTLYVFGDFINSDEVIELDRPFQHADVLQWKGNFNFIYCYQGEVYTGCSNFSLLPLYYRLESNEIIISNRLVYFKSLKLKPSKSYLLERLIFNYSITNQTLFSGVHSLPSFHLLTFESGFPKLRSYLDWEALITEKPMSIEEAKTDVVDQFISTAKAYFPEEDFHCAFTSGFDSRTIFALAQKFAVGKTTGFSFGSANSDDVVFPRELCKKYKWKFDSIVLDQDYLRSEYSKCADKMVVQSEGLSSLSRAHYAFAANYIASKSAYFISGNFGSELFRAVHSDGAITSSLLFDWIEGKFPDTLEALLAQYPKFQFLTDPDWQLAFEDLKYRLEHQSLKIKGDHDLGIKMYYWVWLVAIPNYFGGEMLMQQHYVRHRTPFADFEFFKFIQATDFSGAYEDFKQQNLLKRMRGQKFYPYLLESLRSPLLLETTGKGYKPIDIIDFKRYANLALGKFFRSSHIENQDPFLSKAALDQHKFNWETQLGHAIFSDVHEWENCTEEYKRVLISVYLFFAKLRD